MSAKSAFSVGLAHKVCIAAENEGYTPELLNALAERPGLFRQLLQVQLGRAEVKMLERVPSVLEIIGMIRIPATIKQFVAREHFVVDTSRKARVKIVWLGDDFDNWFLNKTEAPAAGAKLDYARLTRLMTDDEIRKEIGAGCEETTLAAIWALMERQLNGESGILLTNGYANIFYVRDTNGVLRAVGAFWLARAGGWYLSADSVSSPSRWYDGRRVFSRNSSHPVIV